MSLVGASRCENLSIKPKLKAGASFKEDQVSHADLTLAAGPAKPTSAYGGDAAGGPRAADIEHCRRNGQEVRARDAHNTGGATT
jgi:hypothetical protein